MKNSLESLRAEAEKQQARAEGLAEQVAALRHQLNEAKALANFYGNGYTNRLEEIRHIKLSEAGKRGALAKQLNQLRAEKQDLQLEVERVMNEKDAIDEVHKSLGKQYLEMAKYCEQLESRLKRHCMALVKLMRRNLWQRIINKPVTISGKTETTEDHEQKPEVSTPAQQ